jgi:hypothetical protein
MAHILENDEISPTNSHEVLKSQVQIQIHRFEVYVVVATDEFEAEVFQLTVQILHPGGLKNCCDWCHYCLFFAALFSTLA